MTVRRALAVVAWALVVLVCSGAVWGVIRTAGTGVTTSPSVPESTGAALSTERATPSQRPHRRHHRRVHPSRTPSTPTATPSPPAVTPRATPRPTPTDRAGGTGGRGQATPGGSQQPVEVRRTWQGEAGAVVAGCRGSRISLHGAQPNSGWSVEVGNRGPEQIEVHFATREDDGGEVELSARCVGGEPRFSTSRD